MWVRMSTLQGPRNQSDEDVEQLLKVLKEGVLPTARQMRGFKGVLALGDQSTGKSVTLTLWENEEALRASDEAADELRRSAAEQMDEEIAAVERFELYLSEWPSA